MEFWTYQLQSVQRRIAEIEDKITWQQQEARQFQTQDTDTSLRLIAVMEESLARAKIHLQYVEQWIAAHQNEPDRQRHVDRQQVAVEKDDPERSSRRSIIRRAIDFARSPRAWPQPPSRPR